MRLLEVKDLATYFSTEAGTVKAVDGVGFDVGEGEVVGLVGESGSGKTVTALSILRVVPRPGMICRGKALFKGTDLLRKSEREIQSFRGKHVAMIFQDPTTSLNPTLTCGEQVAEVVRTHKKMGKSKAVERVVEIFQSVGLPDAALVFHKYPHQLSGGMRQRVAIARALCSDPELVLADEPTTNLDVTTQAQVLELMKELKKKLNMSILLITHDMGIVAEMCSRVVVLYAGRVCEIGDVMSVFESPLHPYTEALLYAVPSLDARKPRVIPGSIPDMLNPPSGCRFHPRCVYAKHRCTDEVPQLKEVEPRRFVACLKH